MSLLTPAMLLSASSVMCDVMMLACWLWACILWIDGLEKNKLVLLISAGTVLGACALAKYFGAALIPLLFVYSIVRQRRLRRWAWCLLIPLVMIAGYEFWTRDLYG